MNTIFKYSFNWALSQNVKQQHAKCNLVPLSRTPSLKKAISQCLRHWKFGS